ncbi:MAG TPA: viperin family antiviral radical SAM protein [Longimicrobium sp.]|nr:viperin family antiviral radical SAM protein [Longimicrobium sp.]
METDGITLPISSTLPSDPEPWVTHGDDEMGTPRTMDSRPPLPPSVNYHLWAPCNMRCRFCFAPFQDVVSQVLPRGHLPLGEALRLVRLLARRFEKVSFAGGEPTLCPWLPELVAAAKAEGATTMLVTNGSRLAQSIGRLQPALDWVTLSIDSASTHTLLTLGRAVQGKTALAPEQYIELATLVRRAGMRLKVNTVVTSLNWSEDLAPLIQSLHPERWKLLRVLPVEGQNSGSVEPLLCTDGQFAAFVQRHSVLTAEGIETVPEDNDDMRGSYAMVDPAGRFFDNASGGHRYTAPILREGIDEAWAQATFFMDRFDARGGRYEWGGDR